MCLYYVQNVFYNNNYLYSCTYMHVTTTTGDMVEAWLKMKDDVFSESGEPTWTTLSDALKSINQTSLADKIIGNYLSVIFVHTLPLCLLKEVG